MAPYPLHTVPNDDVVFSSIRYPALSASVPKTFITQPQPSRVADDSTWCIVRSC